MSKRIHVQVKIFFSDPYVVRVDFETGGNSNFGYPFHTHTEEFRKIKSKTYKLIQGTWGWTHPEYETITDEEPDLSKNWFGGERILRSYFCFKSELDALQFRLMNENRAIQVHMWPERLFTIHEIVEDNE